jgi:hypothetical protein
LLDSDAGDDGDAAVNGTAGVCIGDASGFFVETNVAVSAAGGWIFVPTNVAVSAARGWSSCAKATGFSSATTAATTGSAGAAACGVGSADAATVLEEEEEEEEEEDEDGGADDAIGLSSFITLLSTSSVSIGSGCPLILPGIFLALGPTA